MKHPYFRILAAIVLTFGLSSCKSDNSDNLPKPIEDGFTVDSVDYIHKDKSIHKINDTKRLSIDSSIQLSLNESSSSGFSTKTETRCHGGSISDNYIHKQNFKNQVSVPVTDLLPIEAFKPLKNIKNQIYCDFNMEIKSSKDSITTVDLKGIKITNLYNFRNIDTTDSKDKISHYILDTMLHQTIESPFDKGNLYLLCGNDIKSLKIESKEVSVSLIKEYEFLKEDINFCRFVFENPASKNRRLSRPFYFQKKKVALDFDISFDLAQPYLHNNPTNHLRQINIPLNDQNFATMTITNPGTLTAYVNLTSLGLSQADFKAYYTKINSLGKGIYSPTYSSKINWTLKKGFKMKKNGTMFLKILPDESAQFVAHLPVSLSCHKGFSGLISSPSSCLAHHQFQGYFIHLSKMPILNVNQLSSLENLQWESYSTHRYLPKQLTLNEWNYQLWKKQSFTPEICKNLTSDNVALPDGISHASPSNNNLTTCQWN